MDRAALDVALKHEIDCGGWCPAGRVDEFGRIPGEYPLKELKQGNKEGRSLDRPGGLETAAPWEKRGIFAERTLANVRDSDGTIVFYCEQLSGGTDYTVECCKQLQRPHQLIDASKLSVERGAKLICDFTHKYNIEILNVAGPRQSEWADGYGYAFRVLDRALNSIRSKSTRLRQATARQASRSKR